MSHSNGDKIVTAQEEEGHWIFFSVRDDKDNGSIVDFVQRRVGGSLGEVRETLRQWISCPLRGQPFRECALTVEPEPRRICSAFAWKEIERTDSITQHRYLEEERGIPRDILSDSRFAGRIRLGARGNAIFPHENARGLCGFEIKNQNFTGFSPAGEKGLWKSASFPDDDTVVICESGIDALSHFALKRPEKTRYVSIAGSMNGGQPLLLREVAKNLVSEHRLIIATDNDEGGDRLTCIITEAFSGLESVQSLRIDPLLLDRIWNDVLRGSETP